MKVEQRLMLIVDMTDSEAEMCKIAAEKIVFNGTVDWGNPVVQLWLEYFSAGEAHKLLMAATAMPQRLLISYINHLEVKS